jgi:enolase-phosphatase E1
VPIAFPSVRVVLLDIEGTTTPISFVHDVLFPYARARLREFLQFNRDAPVVSEALRRLVTEHATEHAEDRARGEHPPLLPPDDRTAEWLAAVVAYAEWLMDRDRKSPALKILQGLIWDRGYERGELAGQVFADVPPAIRRWREAGLRVAIYSSGSVLAQQRLFESVPGGSLVPVLDGFFDTSVGAKIAADSYTRIAATLGVTPGEILFVSDVTRELDAASAAGLRVVLSVRPGNASQPPHAYPDVTTFDDLAPALMGPKTRA